jgi:hypothetical protein
MSSSPKNSAALAYWSAAFRKEPPATYKPWLEAARRADDHLADLDPPNAPADQWAALKDHPGNREIDRLRFLVMEENAALLRLMADPASGWKEQPADASSTHGPLRVWNGTDLNGQHYQLLLVTPVNTAIL